MTIRAHATPMAPSPRPNGDSTATAIDSAISENTKALRCAMERSSFVRRCAQSLLLDTAVTATAITLCQRFYAQRGESQLDHHVIGGACVFLATKSCEVPRTLRSVVNVVHAVLNNTTEPLGADQARGYNHPVAYANLKNSLINAEQTVLRVLRFDVDVVLPHAFLLNYAHHLRVRESTTQCALALVDDVICTPDALRFPPTSLAAGCLHLACQIVQDDAAAVNDKWWYHYDTRDDDLLEIARLVELISDAAAADPKEKQVK